MTTSRAEPSTPAAVRVKVSRLTMSVELDDGRTITVPIEWYPRLAHASSRERQNWQLIGTGQGIHWPELDEDVSVEGILRGRRSAESKSSFDRWLARRVTRSGSPIQPARASRRPAARRRVRG